MGPTCVRSSALFSVSDSQCLDEKPLKKEILYKCTLYPFTLLFPLLSYSSLVFSSSPLFICDNSSLSCEVEQVVSLFMRTFCKWLSFLSSFLHSSVSRSVVYKVDIPSSPSRRYPSPSHVSYPLFVGMLMIDVSRVGSIYWSVLETSERIVCVLTNERSGLP